MKQLIIAFVLYKLFFEPKPKDPRGEVFIEGGPSNEDEWQQWDPAWSSRR